MFVYLIVSLLLHTCSFSLGNPVTKSNVPPVSIALEKLAKTCESSLLASTVNSTVGQCKYDVAQRPTYTQKQEFECLLFYDISTQLCNAVAINHLSILKEDMAKITQQVDVETLCTYAKDWKMLNLQDYPLYKITVDKVFSSEINCARVCSVEEVTSQDSNFFCKYYKWGMELLASSNSASVHQANNIPLGPVQKDIPQQQPILQQPVLHHQPTAQQQLIPQQPIPQQQPIPHQEPIPQQQPVPLKQIPDMVSEKGRVNIASTKSTDDEVHSANVDVQQSKTGADHIQKLGSSQPYLEHMKLDGAEVDEVSFQQPSPANQYQNQETKSTSNNKNQAGISSQAQNPAQVAGGSLNVGNTASLENPSGAAVAPNGEQSEISGKPLQDKLDEEKKSQANTDVEYQDDEDKPQNFGEGLGDGDADPDNLGEVEDGVRVDQNKNNGVKTGALANNNIMPDYSDDDEDHFFSFFLTVIIMVVLLYILYHNKNKVSKVFFGLILEGRQGRRRNSRGHAYRRLDTLEQAMSTNSAAPPSKIIY